MRVLPIVAGLLLVAASICPAQVPSPPAPSATHTNPALQQQLEELKAKYGRATLDENSNNEAVLQPKPGRQNLSFSGDARAVYTTLGSAFGLRATFDDSAPTRSVRFALENVDFKAAAETAALMTRTFIVPISSHEFLVAADNAQKRRELDRMLQRTFYLSDALSPQDITDVVNLLRTILEIRYVVPQPGTNSITVRADQASMHQAEQLLNELDLARPQVTLEIEAIEVNSSMQRNIGLNLPLQFQMFNIGSNVLALLNSPNAQSLLQQFLNSGGADVSQLAALIGQSQSELQALLKNPIATFGGGLTLMGVGIPPASFNLSQNSSRVTTLEKASVQASQGNPAMFHVGNRYPVLTQSFSSGLSVPGLNLGLVGAIPGFTYEDLGLLLKAKPQIHGISDVTLDMELSIKSLGAQVFNGVPVIQNREYKGVITVANGEPAVIAGIISNSESKSLVGPPGLGSIPILKDLVSSHINSDDKTELIILVTPHITRKKMLTETRPVEASPSR